jgi:hypothetical protein
VFSDDALLAECAIDCYRASGPGGQKRNKTSSAVRLRHLPTGLAAIAEESRSQHENKAKALDRLRGEIAVHMRAPLLEAVRFPPTIHVEHGRLRVRPDNPGFHVTTALILDALNASLADPRAAAERLGLTSTSMVRFLAEHGGAWAEANRMRAAHGLGPLRA